MEQVQVYGSIFTRRWVVEAMLDLCGYVAEDDLASKLAVEPACGDGAFLLPMIERLSVSLKQHGHDLADASHAVQACDLQSSHVSRTRQSVRELLATEGWDETEASKIARIWVQQGDYLLASHAPEADFVIGNPPYIRSEDLSIDLRARYLIHCKTMTPGADIFVGFIEKGLVSLKPGGVLCYIVADRWQHNTYGRKLRRMVADNFAVEAMFEMHGVDAFAEDVSAYPAITQIRKTSQLSVAYATTRTTFDADSASRLVSWARRSDNQKIADPDFSGARLPEWFDTEDVWPSGSPARLATIEELNERCMPLESLQTGTKVGIGIATGADGVFLTVDAEAVEPEHMLPLVTTGHIRTGKVDWSPAVWLVNPWDDHGRLVDLADAPNLSDYLHERGDALRQRHIARNAGDGWYRTIDKVQQGLADKPKLLLQDMKATIQPVYDQGHYPHHNLYWVTSEKWNLRVLGGILLSRVAQMFIEAYGVKMRGGTLRFQAQYLRKIRVPDPDSLTSKVKRELERAFDSRNAQAATEAALVAYGLTGLPE